MHTQSVSVYLCYKNVCLGFPPLHWSGCLPLSALFPGHCSIQAEQGDASSLLGCHWHVGDSCCGPRQVVSLGHCWVVQRHHYWTLGCIHAWHCLLVIHPVGMGESALTSAGLSDASVLDWVDSSLLDIRRGIDRKLSVLTRVSHGSSEGCLIVGYG